MENNFKTFIDVRTPGEYREGHFPGAINIPLGEVTARMEKIKELPQPIALYCKSGNRSGMAASILQQNGMEAVVNVGGLEDMMRFGNEKAGK